MQVQRVQNNNYNNPKFGARFPEIQMGHLLHDKYKDPVYISKLYTLLELLDKHPGKIASFSQNTQYIESLRPGAAYNGYNTSIRSYATLYIDERPIRSVDTMSIFKALKHAMTDFKPKNGEYGEFIEMPESVFDQMWWKNRDKTVEDVKKFTAQV